MPSTFSTSLRWNGVAQNIVVGAASVQSGAGISTNIYEIEISSTTACWINIGVNPTAAKAANNIYLPANVVRSLHVSPGQIVAAIQDAAGGTLNIAEMTR